MLSPELLQKLKTEITTDPDKIYAGKTADEIAQLMSVPITIKTDVLYVTPLPLPVTKVGDKIGETVVVKDPPVFRVIIGTAGAPNAFTAKDISDALSS